MQSIQNFLNFVELAVNIGVPVAASAAAWYGIRVYRQRAAAAKLSLSKATLPTRRR